MEGFLNNSPKFNNSLSDLLFLTFSIKTVSFREFRYTKTAKTLYFQAFFDSTIFVSVIRTLPKGSIIKSKMLILCGIPPHPFHLMLLFSYRFQKL